MKAPVRQHGFMRRGQRKVQKEGFVAFRLPLNVAGRLRQQVVEAVFHHQLGRSFAFPQKLRKWLRGLLEQRVLRVLPVLDVNVGREIERRRNDVGEVEASRVGPVADRLAEVECAIRGFGETEPQVPFPDDARVIAVLPQKRSHGSPPRLDQWLAVAVEHAALEPRAPAIAPGQQAVTGGRAYRRRRMSVGEGHALGGKFVEMRSGDFRFRIQRVNVAVAHVVGEDENDIGMTGSRRRKANNQAE